MSFGKFRFIGVYLLLISGFGCNDQGFNGSASTRETPEQRLETAEADAVNAVPAVEESAVEVSISQLPVAACKEKLSYDPSQIQCSLKAADKKTIWDITSGWKERVDSLKNANASWISPLAAVESPATVFACPFVPDSDRLIFVSNFTLSADTEISLEAVIDDLGSIRLWKNGDSAQEVYISGKLPKVDATLKLSKGFYSVVGDGMDAGKGATGMIMTIFDAAGAVIRQTETSAKDWCIFRVKADTDVASFVNAASSCRSCLIGNR